MDGGDACLVYLAQHADTYIYIYIYPARTYNPTCISMHTCVHTQSGSLRTRGQIDRYYSRFPFQLFSVKTAPHKGTRGGEKRGGKKKRKQEREANFCRKFRFERRKKKKKRKEKRNAFPFNSVENILDPVVSILIRLKSSSRLFPSLGIPRKM